MEFKQLESFAAVVRLQSFTKAAEFLFTSQPTVSAHIRMLEEELGVRLITRTTKTVEITARGWELYECAGNIFDLRDSLLRRWKGTEDQCIRIGASTIPSAYVLPEILPEFRKKHDEILFSVGQGDSAAVVSGVLYGNYDLGLVGMENPDDRLEYTPFYRDHIVLITPNTEYYRDIYKTGVDNWTDFIRKEPIILRETGSGSRKAADVFLAGLSLDEENMNIAARIDDQESIKNLVAGGLGIALISEKAIENLVEQEKVLVFSLPDENNSRYLYIVHRKDYIIRTQVKQFVLFVKEFYEL